MIFVPATGREEPECEEMSELDQEMSKILRNPRLSIKEKVEMYNEVLRRNLIFESRLMQKHQAIENKLEAVVDSALDDSMVPETPKNSETSFLTSLIDQNALKTPFFDSKLKLEFDHSSEIKKAKKIRRVKKQEEQLDDDDVDLDIPEEPEWEEYKDDYMFRPRKIKTDYFESASSLQESEKRKKLLKQSKKFKKFKT
jgi:hypothetical protein